MPILKPLTTEAKRGIPCDNYEINKEYGTARPGSLMLIVGCHMPLVLLTPSMIIFQLHCQMYLSKFQSISPLMSYLCLVKINFYFNANQYIYSVQHIKGILTILLFS